MQKQSDATMRENSLLNGLTNFTNLFFYQKAKVRKKLHLATFYTAWYILWFVYIYSYFIQYGVFITPGMLKIIRNILKFFVSGISID